jgi:hypothetical protein
MSTISADTLFHRVAPDHSVAFTVDVVGAQLRFLLGDVLTVIDATALNDRQVKAAKDLVRNVFRKREDYFKELAGQRDVQITAEQAARDYVMTSSLPHD